MSVEAAISQNVAPSDTHTRLHGRGLWLARAAWVALVLLTLSLYLFSVPIAYTKALTICTAGQCDPSQLTPKAVLELQQLGLPANFLALYSTLTNVLFVLGCLSVAIVIFWRRSDDWMALLGSLMLATFGIATFSGSLDNMVASYPALQPINAFINLYGFASFLLFFYLFPNGRFEPRWTRWMLLLFLAFGVLSPLSPSSPMGDNAPGIFYFIPLASILFVQTYRYWKVSGTVERQQTKWVVFGTTAALGGFLGLFLFLNLLVLNAETIRGPSVLVSMVLNAAFILCLALIPISLMIAILRYRLWEIDLLINRTLVYVPLTAILAGIFAASITLSQRLSAALTGQSSDAATVLTTLIVVAAFEPLKSGLQHLVDRRFKETPDPIRELRAFGDQVRAVLEVTQANALANRLLDTATRAFDAQGGAVFLESDGDLKLLCSSKEWNGKTKISVPLETNGKQLGLVSLGARRNGADYSSKDHELLQQIALMVAQAIEQDIRKS